MHLEAAVRRKALVNLGVVGHGGAPIRIQRALDGCIDRWRIRLKLRVDSVAHLPGLASHAMNGPLSYLL